MPSDRPETPVITRWRRAAGADIGPDAYATAFQLSAIPKAFLDADGRVRAANAALGDLLDTDPDTLHGMRLHDLFPEGERDRADAFLQGAFAWTEASREVTLLRGDGTRIEADLHARLILPDDGERFLYFTATDARERRQRARVHAVALESSRAANVATAPREVGEGVLRAIEAAIPELDHLAFFVQDDARDALVAVADLGLGETWRRDHGVQPHADGPASTLLVHAAERRETVFLLDADLEAPEHPMGLPAQVGSVLAVPVLAGDTLAGAMLAATGPDVHLDLDDVRCAEIAAAEAASALQRLEATRQLSRSQTRYRAVVERVGDGVLTTDPDGRLLEANPLARKLLGWHDENPSNLLDALPDQATKACDFLRRVATDERATDHFDLHGGDRRRHVRIDGVRPDDTERLVLLVRDATAEARNRRLRDLTAGVQAAIVAAEPGPLPARELARAAQEATGAEAVAYASFHDRGMIPLARAGRANELDLMDEPFATWLKDAVTSGEPRLVTFEPPNAPDLRHFTLVPARTGAEPLGVLLLAHGERDVAPFEPDDLPWLRVASDKLARGIQHHRANQRVRLALERERTVLARIRRLNEELKDFTLWTTHDLREPLRSLGTLAGFLREDLEGTERTEEVALARQIEQSAEALKERIFALHDFGVLMQEEKPVVEQDLDAVVDRVLAQLRPRIEERSARVRVAPDLPRVHAQADRLEILLLNLVENAIKYGNAERPEVRIGTRLKEDAVEIFVEDNGPGLPASARDQLFRPFYRRAEHRNLPGSGMGLAIVQRIASQHAGEAWVEDADDGGARFVVRIPDAQEKE